MNYDQNPGVITPALKLAKKLQDNRSSLHIGRIPEKTRSVFIAIAEEEFCSDYGMLLKFLVDKALEKEDEEILEKIASLEQRIEALESEEDSNEIKTLNGRKFKKGVKDE